MWLVAVCSVGLGALQERFGRSDPGGTFEKKSGSNEDRKAYKQEEKNARVCDL